MQKDLERSVALFCLRTQKRSFPAVEQESCQRLGIRSSGKFLLRNCLLNYRRDRVLPVVERSADPFSQLRTLLCDFKTEAAHHASGDRSFLAIDLREIAEVTPQTLQGERRRIVQDSRRMLPLAHPIPFQRSCGEVLFAAEMVIEGTLGHICCLQNVGQSGRVVPVLVHQLQGPRRSDGHASILRP